MISWSSAPRLCIYGNTDIAGTTEYFYKIPNNGNSENKHFEFILAFDYILVIIRNDVSYITVMLI